MKGVFGIGMVELVGDHGVASSDGVIFVEGKGVSSFFFYARDGGRFVAQRLFGGDQYCHWGVVFGWVVYPPFGGVYAVGPHWVGLIDLFGVLERGEGCCFRVRLGLCYGCFWVVTTFILGVCYGVA